MPETTEQNEATDQATGTAGDQDELAGGGVSGSLEWLVANATDSETKSPQETGEGPADETKPAEKPAAPDEKPAEAEAKPEEAKKAEEAPGFDADAWAAAAGIDRDLLKKCTNEREALDTVGRHYRELSTLQGRQANELGALRREKEERGRAGAAPPAEAKQPTAEQTAAAQQRVLLQLTPEQIGQYHEWHDRDPVAAESWMSSMTILPSVERLIEERVEAKLRADRERRQEHDEDAAAQRELADLMKAHPDAEARRPKMVEIYDQLAAVGRDVPFGALYELAGLAESDAGRFRDSVDLMREGMSFARAKEHLDLRAAKKAEATGAGTRARETLARTTKAAAPGGSPAPLPDVPAGLRKITDLEDNAFRVLMGEEPKE